MSNIKNVNYNNFAKTFSNSRKNMKWEELEYFLPNLNETDNILDIGCGNGRFLSFLLNSGVNFNDYTGIDLSRGLLDEALKSFPDFNFLEMNMLDIDKLNGKYDKVFLIASYHHLLNYNSRLNFLIKLRDKLNKGAIVMMTNWALNSELNLEKYKNSIIEGSLNNFGGLDYCIKIGSFQRFYHCFSLVELNNLFLEAGFDVIENRLFDNNRNFISIIKST